MKENYIWYSTKYLLNSSTNLIKYFGSSIWYAIYLTAYESDKFNYDEIMYKYDENILNELIILF
ncbi:hypothetical protein [Spiroplasma citri]|uniref:hypothetical protein n=1 Tax=Spiroplasma citri TaxID=2133 RepID=UPI0011BBD154|nr:hypothetical protein [Spiroplasma citri]QED25629.1 hypothetical protein FRX96_10135 [Spiroplasma citri]